MEAPCVTSPPPDAAYIEDLLKWTCRQHACPTDFGALKVGDELGVGTMGRVYAATAYGRDFALKRLKLSAVRLWRAARAAATADADVPPVEGGAPTKRRIVDESRVKEGMAEVLWQQSHTPRGFLFEANEWLSEFTVSRLLSAKMLEREGWLRAQPGMPAPTMHPSDHIVHTLAAWRGDRHAYILMQRAGHKLHSVIKNLTVEQLQSVVLQVLIAVVGAQTSAAFKHQDLHVHNVFLDGTSLNEPQTYVLEEGGRALVVAVPFHGVLARIGDFGLSAAGHRGDRVRHDETRVFRADAHILDSVKHPEVWGVFTPYLHGAEMYDVLYFLGDVLMYAERHAHLAKWAHRMFATLTKGRDDVLRTPARGRPTALGENGPSAFVTLKYLLECVDWKGVRVTTL